jgi:hypothetical protein
MRDADGFRGFDDFILLKVLFIATDVSFRSLNNVSCLFVSFLLIRSGVLLFSDKSGLA